MAITTIILVVRRFYFLFLRYIFTSTVLCLSEHSNGPNFVFLPMVLRLKHWAVIDVKMDVIMFKLTHWRNARMSSYFLWCKATFPCSGRSRGNSSRVCKKNLSSYLL